MATGERAGTGLQRGREELARRLGRDQVLDDPLALALYGRDASMIEGAAALVAFPRDRDEVVACLETAERHGLPVVPRGSGTGLAGGSAPMDGALVVVTTKMDRVLEVRPDDWLGWSSPGSSTSTSPSGCARSASSSPPTRRLSRPPASAGTWPPTPAGRTASPTA